VRKLRLLGVSLIAVLALGGVSASTAGANVLQLAGPEVGPLPDGENIGLFMSIGVGDCFEGVGIAHGTLSVNDARTDKVTDPFLSGPTCEDAGDSLSGGLENVTMSLAGKGIVKTDKLRVHLTKPKGHCAYEFKTLSGTFEVGGEAVIRGSSVGKLYKPESTPGCASSKSTSFAFELLEFGNEILVANSVP
jgi:hypothetical protein